MLILSVRQPWAWLIISGFKDIENRNWATKQRGRVLIHAAKGMTFGEYEECLSMCHSVSKTIPFPPGTVMPSFASMERGGIIGSVEIVDCVKTSDSPWFVGKFGFVLQNPKPIRFYPCKGQLKFFRHPGIDMAEIAHDIIQTPHG